MAVFSALIFISIVISVEYIVFNKIVMSYRFVTFQSGFLPIVSGVIFAYIILTKNILHKTLAAFLLVLIVVGTFVTLTRTLWVTTILVLILTLIFYQISNNKLSAKKIVLYLIILTLPLYLARDMGGTSKQQITSNESVQYRTSSVANPLEDSSFLMRVEFTYYAIQRFLEDPLFGKGLGDYLKYKIFNTDQSPNYYLDNSWIYFLWKGGIIGFLLFLVLYIRYFKSAYSVLIKTSDPRIKAISLGLLAGVLGLSCLGFLSPLLIKYKTNVLLIFIFAYIEFEMNKINERKIKPN